MIRWIATWVGLAALLGRAEDPADRLVRAGIAEFNAAYQAWDGPGFAAAAERFREAVAGAPDSSTNHYWLGVAEFHRMLQLRSLPDSRTNRLAAAEAMEAALAALEAAVKLEEGHAESHALLGTLYGMKMDGNVLRALRLGPRVNRERKKALESGADNPRVRYLLGTCQFHTAKKPAAFREALDSLLSAQKLFVAEAGRAAAPLEPRWGYSSCLTFIGRTYEKLGQPADAAGYYRKALARQPSDHVAREGLERVAKTK